MMKSLRIHPFAKELARIANALHDKGLVTGRSGNISAMHEDILWITPTGYAMKDVQPENLVMIWPDGRVIAGEGLAPSSESAMHRRIYEARPDVQAVVHAHPIKASALAVAHQPLDTPLLSEIVLTLGTVPVVPFQPPGSEALADSVAEALKTHDAVMMANHGVTTVGRTLADAYYNMELVETFAEIYLTAHQLGNPQPLTPEQIRATVAQEG